MPISIPNMMGRWQPGGGAPGGGGGGGPDADGGADGQFCPPHQMSQRDDGPFMFSFAGGDAGGARARDRLRTRNAILARTGFLEEGAGAAGGGLSHERTRIAAGGLSQALHSNV